MALDVAARAIEDFSARYAPFPYTELDIVSTPTLALGIEYPGIIAITSRIYDVDSEYRGAPASIYMESTVAHEVGHQWFYGLVGSDGARDPYADEASATFLGGVASGIWRSTSCPEKRLDLSIYKYSNACYFGQIYVQGGNVLRDVRQAMGSPAYWRGIREYVANHRFGIGSTEALFETLQANTGVNLRPILEPRFPSLY